MIFLSDLTFLISTFLFCTNWKNSFLRKKKVKFRNSRKQFPTLDVQLSMNYFKRWSHTVFGKRKLSFAASPGIVKCLLVVRLHYFIVALYTYVNCSPQCLTL